MLLDFDHRGELIPHRCCKCGDTGRVALGLPLGDPMFGKTVPCRCQTGDEAAANRPPFEPLAFGVPYVLRDCQIHTWKPNNHSARIAAQNLVAQWPPSRPFLVLWGEPGRGKSHLAAAVIRAAYEKYGVHGYYQNVPDLVSRLRATFADDAEETAESVERFLIGVPLLVLDDAGKERQTPLVRESFYRVINSRHGRGSATVVTCNPEEWEQFDTAVKSRLRDTGIGVVVECSGPDHRPRRGEAA